MSQGISASNLSMIIGADEGNTANPGRTNNTDKACRIGLPHRVNSEEPAAIMVCASTNGVNQVTIGGGTSVMNAATEIRFNTAANATTPTGTRRLTIASTGLISTNTDINTNISVTNSKDGSAAGFGLIRVDADAASYSASTRAFVADFSGTDHSSAQIALQFSGAQGVKGTIVSSGNTTCTFSASSDERLKTDIQDLTDGLTTLNTLKPRKYKWISEGEDAKYDHGFVAQELYEDYSKPVLVGGEDPKTEPWSIENQSLVPILVKALQEADAKIEALTLRVTALEG